MATPKLDNNTVYLIDGSGYIFRAYFAVRALNSKKGVPTNAVYGFTTMLIKLLREHKPKFLGIAFDRKEPTFRHEIYAGYKANRPPPPADLVPQFDLIHQVVQAFNIKILTKAGFEADDLIATIATRAKKTGHEVVVVTGDKDFMQIVDDSIFLLDELRASKVGAEKFIDELEVKKQMGVSSEHITDLLALAGDSSDNIPGISGIGFKTAAELIQEFGDLEKIIAMAPLIKQKSRREKIIGGQELARISKKLATIKKDVEFECELSDLIYKNINEEKTRELFNELDFNRLLRDENIFNQKNNRVPNIINNNSEKKNYQIINTLEELEALINKLKEVTHIALSIKTHNHELFGVGLSWSEYEGAEITQANLLAKIFPIFSDPHKFFIAHNAKLTLKNININLNGDPMLANYLLHQDQESHKLEDLSQKYLNYKIEHAENLSLSEKANLVFRLEKILVPELKRHNLSELYYFLELPLEKVLADMENYGVLIDKNKLLQVKEDLSERLKKLEEEAYVLAGSKFNLASPKQVSEILFEKLGLVAQKKTKTGLSTDSSVLEKLALKHPLPAILLQHRLCAKLINTYVETLPKLIDPKTGRLHTNFNQFVAATGRLSSSDPNLQNIPIRTPEGRRIRQAFVAKPGSVLISLDYSQVELRILAYVSNDQVLLDSFNKNQDVHKRTASEIFEVALSDVTKEQRNTAKTINFGLLYGMGAQRLAESLKISRATAQAYLSKYFAKYNKVAEWKNQALLSAKKNNEIRTLFGRRRLVPELSSENNMLRARAERLAINTPIQGSNADIIKKAMIETDKYLRESFPDAHLILQVHDELVIEAPKEYAERIAEHVAKIMSAGHGLELDLKVDYNIASNWDDAH